MAFVNEYVLDEDTETARNAWKAFNPFWTDSDEKLIGKFSWTIDKERDVFFIPVSTGRYEKSDQKTCVLSWQGVLLLVTIVTLESELDYANKTGRKKWGLLDIWKPKDFIVADTDIIPVLKEALLAYGQHGMHSYATDYPITFAF
jgi:hypothetical protein